MIEWSLVIGRDRQKLKYSKMLLKRSLKFFLNFTTKKLRKILISKLTCITYFNRSEAKIQIYLNATLLNRKISS